jgi:hypothetical protein
MISNTARLELLAQNKGAIMDSPSPWEVHSDLQAERLTSLAQCVVRARQRAVDATEGLEGPIGWSRGCVAYQQCCNEIIALAEKESWLEVLDPSLCFIFRIGKVPVRLFTGDADAPNTRTLRLQETEAEAAQLAFPYAFEGADWLWRLAIETDIDGRVLRVVLAEYSQWGDVRTHWEIPLDDIVLKLTPVEPKEPKGVELPKPKVGGVSGNRRAQGGATRDQQ